MVTGQQATGDLTISNPNPSVGDLLRVNVANLLDGNGLAADVAITMTRQAFVNGQWRIRQQALSSECWRYSGRTVACGRQF